MRRYAFHAMLPMLCCRCHAAAIAAAASLFDAAFAMPLMLIDAFRRRHAA